MTAKFDYYELSDPERGPAGGFIYETVPHITLESIAKNTEIDAIAAKYQPQIDQALAELNKALKGKRVKIEVKEGGRAGQFVDFSAPDSQTATLPSGQEVRVNELLEWEVPREVPHPVWPKEAQRRVSSNCMKLKRLGTVGGRREGGSFAGNGLPPDRSSLGAAGGCAGPDATGRLARSCQRRPAAVLGTEACRSARRSTRASSATPRRRRFTTDPKWCAAWSGSPARSRWRRFPCRQWRTPRRRPFRSLRTEEAQARVSDRGGDYLTTMINLLKQQGGVLFPGGKRAGAGGPAPAEPGLSARRGGGEATERGSTCAGGDQSFGPQHGPVIAHQVQEAIPTAQTERLPGVDRGGICLRSGGPGAHPEGPGGRAAGAFCQHLARCVGGRSAQDHPCQPDFHRLRPARCAGGSAEGRQRMWWNCGAWTSTTR
ncbi:MAG: hypothetical protein KatS3mg087_1730 [Patescibacteria group bacterium]|nr:MAG: hypothetical protein KatS3mg087_1730 [Patescibacteria group bacterium]